MTEKFFPGHYDLCFNGNGVLIEDYFLKDGKTVNPIGYEKSARREVAEVLGISIGEAAISNPLKIG